MPKKVVKPTPDTAATMLNADTVVLSQTFNKTVYGRLKRYKSDFGFTSEQEVIRVAAIYFLKQNGY